jgi:DNA invertase Pin-like site-specific DNA recombinase
MSHPPNNGHGLDLSGDGAAYVRVSDDDQEPQRQRDTIHAFEQRHGVTIPPAHWFEDLGWARDTADRRPAFQRLMGLVEAGKVKWIVVAELDRFGMKNAKQLIAYLHRLEEAGCRLFDAAGKDWTAEDIATVINAVIKGDQSKGEQHNISNRVLGAKVGHARAGEWQGGQVRLGFDVGCYSLATGQELWRVILTGRAAGPGTPLRRLKVWPDGRTECFDGPDNFPRTQPATEVLRITPSHDRAKLDAVRAVFARYATEAVSFTTLAHWLTGLGFHNSLGGPFQGNHIEADWVTSPRLFEPIIDAGTWVAVAKKLEGRRRRPHAPTAAALYLAGLVVCGTCGQAMVAHPARRRAVDPTGQHEFYCSTYHKAVRDRWRKTTVDGVVVRVGPGGQECRCGYNCINQAELGGYVERYLEEIGRRLELLGGATPTPTPTGRLEEQEGGAWKAYVEGFDRLTAYLAEHHPAEYAALMEADQERAAAEPGWPQTRVM